MLLCPKRGCSLHPGGASCTRSKALRTLLRQGGGLRLARPLRMGDNRKPIVAPSIASTALLRANHHVSQRVLLTRPSRCAISADVTHTRTALRSLPRRRNRLRRVGLRARGHMRPRAFQIHTIHFVAILTVHVMVSFQSQDVSAPASESGVVRKTRNGSRTQRPAEPARFPKQFHAAH